MLNVQTYLLTHSLSDLASDHGVYGRFSVKNPFKLTLNYDQLEATDADPISQECRGLVLEMEQGLPESDDMAHTELQTVIGATRVLARPMNRFFNFGQGAAANINFDDKETRFLEKLDGTLCILYWDRLLGEWCVGTRSVPDADLPMDGFGNQTFSDLFWKAWKACGADLSALDYARGLQTFCFELCTPDNQVVVRYDDYKIWLLAVRENATGEESLPEEWARQIGCDPAPSYRIGSIAEMADFVNGREPSKFEGIVVCDKDFRRVKVKNAGYLALNKIKDSVAKSPRAALEVILLEKEDDVFPLVSDATKKWMVETKAKVQKLLHILDAEYVRVYSKDRKTFAIAVKEGSGFLSPQMMRWTGKCSSAHGWILANRSVSGWSDGFLETLLRMCDEIQ